MIGRLARCGELARGGGEIGYEEGDEIPFVRFVWRKSSASGHVGYQLLLRRGLIRIIAALGQA